MKKQNPVCCLLSLALLALPAFAQSSTKTSAPVEEETVKLNPFEVTAVHDKGYQAANSVSATRIATPIADLPFAISAFTPEFIVDTGATDLWDIVKYSAGVSAAGANYNRGTDQYSIRGFVQVPQADGLYTGPNGIMYNDMVGIERVEVVKGPASLLYGAVAPGGTVNYISKWPTATPFSELSLAAGNYGYWRAALDVNQPSPNKKLLFRMNVATEDGFEYMQPSKSRTLVAQPTLNWKITPNLSLKVKYLGFDRREKPPPMYTQFMELVTPASMVAAMTGPNYPSPANALTGRLGPDVAYGNNGSDLGALHRVPFIPRNFNTPNTQDWRRTTYNNINAELDFTIGEHWNGRAVFNFNNNRSDFHLVGLSPQAFIAPPNSLTYSNGAWSVASSWSSLSAAQQLAANAAYAQQVLDNPWVVLQPQNGTPPPVLNTRVPRQQDIWGLNRTAQTEIAGKYELSWVKLKPLVGLYWDVNYITNRIIQNNGSAAAPAFHYWDLDPASPTAYVDRSPVFDKRDLKVNNTNNLIFTSDQAAFAIVQATFFKDKLYVVGGGRYNQSQILSTNYFAPPASAIGPGLRVHYTTPQIGIGYKVTPDVLLYASYSTAYILPTFAVLRTPVYDAAGNLVTSVPTTAAKPIIGEGYEAGIKTDFLQGRVSSTLSVYQIQEDNVVTTVNAIVNGANVGLDSQGAKVRSRGVELEVTWSPMDNWQVIASATEDDVRNTAEPIGQTFYLGAHPVATVKTQANFWTRYSFKQGALAGLWLGTGVNYNGKIPVLTQNPKLFMDPTTIWNATVGYEWKSGRVPMTARLEWKNISDVYNPPAATTTNQPMRVIGSFSARF